MVLARRLALGFAFALVLGAPSGARADTDAQIAERLMRVFEHAATIVQANKDCDVMGDKLEHLVDQNAELLRDGHAREKKMTDAQRRALQRRYAARMRAAFGRMAGGLRACMANPKVASAIQRVQ